MGGEHLRFLLAGARPAASHPMPFRWYGGSKFHLTVGDEQVSISLPTVASLFDGTSSSPSKSNAAAAFPGGMDGRAGRGGGELGLDAMLTPPSTRATWSEVFSSSFFAQDMNCKMSNYLMKIHPRLAKCGRRLGMRMPRGTEPTSPRLVVDIRTISTGYVPSEP